MLMQVASPGEGDSIASLNVSLDGAILAVQRGTALIQFIHLQSSKLFVQVLTSHQEAQPVTNAHHFGLTETSLLCITARPFLTSK